MEISSEELRETKVTLKKLIDFYKEIKVRVKQIKAVLTIIEHYQSKGK